MGILSNKKLNTVSKAQPSGTATTIVTKPEPDSPETDIYSREKVIQKYYDMINTAMNSFTANPLETDWGKDLLAAYGVKADNSAQGVKASAAAENSGNVDSYAVANAERQRLAKLGQGIEAINGMNTERNNNLLNLLNNIGVNTQTLLGLTQPSKTNVSVDDLAVDFGEYYTNMVDYWDEEKDGSLINAIIEAMEESGLYGDTLNARYREAAKRYLNSINPDRNAFTG